MSTIKRKHKQLLNTVSVNLGCSCMKPKLFSIFSPKPANKTKLPNYSSKNHKLYQYFSATSVSTQATSSFSSQIFKDYPSSSSSDHLVPYFRFDRSGHQVVGAKTVAVEKDSKDPYLDFRHSMLQMIVENEMYTKDELMELLNCFLQLNSACLHGVIIRVFIDICTSFFFTGAGAYVNPKSFKKSSWMN